MGHVDVEKYITLFLSRIGTPSAIRTPQNNMIVMDYTDGFPWLKRSRHFTGEASVRIKLIEPYNLCMVQFYLLPCPPRAYPRGFAILFSFGGLFPTPEHAARDNSTPPGLLIDHRYIVLCTKHRLRY